MAAGRYGRGVAVFIVREERCAFAGERADEHRLRCCDRMAGVDDR